jgi:hypothetical protein
MCKILCCTDVSMFILFLIIVTSGRPGTQPLADGEGISGLLDRSRGTAGRSRLRSAHTWFTSVCALS